MLCRACVLIAAWALAGCASAPHRSASEGWHDVALPGKELTRYTWDSKDGRPAIAAISDRSASLWRRTVARDPAQLGQVSFSWWVQDLVVNGNVADVTREDAPARVLFSFQGDIRSLPMRTRAMFDLAEALTGERPPFATLMYVWDATAPVGTVIINPRSDRIRKIVVDSGPTQLRRWREHRRDLVADYRLAFGDVPGALSSVAVMTDSDNTSGRARTWYGPVNLH